MIEKPLLEVEDLNVSFPGRGGVTHAVRGGTFVLGRERLGIVGESGSGKSTTGRALLGLIPLPGVVAAKRMELAGQDLRNLDDAEWQKLRGRRISMVMQDPKYSLNPVVKVGRQIQETYRLHRRTDAKDARRRAIAGLEAVKIRDPDLVYDLFPHQLSGGMGQRVMIAMMLMPEPSLLIADEPTSALDVTVRIRVLAILDELAAQRELGLIFISHDLNLVASFCDRVLIMYAGRIVEQCAASELARAQHPYTRGLLASLPRVGDTRSRLPVLTRDPAWLTS